MRKIRKTKKTYLILVEGETEVWYFQMVKRHENIKNIKIEPELPQNRKIKELFGEAKERAKDYDKIYILIDYDRILHNNEEKKLGEEIDKIKRYKNIAVLVNNPCLEFWFLLHFRFTEKLFFNCSEVIKELKDYLKDYKKEKGFYIKKDNDIYLKLKSRLKDAIKNAKRLGNFSFKHSESSKAEIYRIFEEIPIFQ